MTRLPHLSQVLKGPLSARPAAEQTPDWVWYFAWDDDGGAFYRPTETGWVKATPSVGPVAWEDPTLENSWEAMAGHPLQCRRHNGTVELRGAVCRATGGFPSAVTTLPPGHRPAGDRRLPIVVENGLSYVSISRDGVVTVHECVTVGADANGGCYLDGVRFSAGSSAS